MNNPEFGYWLSGFIDAEGSFGIYRHRVANRAFRCRFALTQRIDSIPTLILIQRMTGIGRVMRISRKKGNDEAEWVISSQAECEKLALLLERFPLRSKKRRDLDVWRRALLIPGTERAPLAQEMSLVRAFDASLQTPRSQNKGFYNWLGGFIDGEGCFGISSVPPRGYACNFQLRVRIDDRGIMEEIHERTGLGSLRSQGQQSTSRPRICWSMWGKSDVNALSELIESGQILLWGSKKYDYDIWYRGLESWNLSRGKRPPSGREFDWTTMRLAREELSQMRKCSVELVPSD